MAVVDPRLVAFRSTQVPELFHGVQHPCHVWLPDPFDVTEIHADARSRFAGLVAAAAGGGIGRLMLLHGEPGAGKTHLMRAFRAQVHRQGLGFFAYLQMTSSSRQYGRYVLQKLVESLEQPYDPPREPASGLRVLSNALASRLPADAIAAAQEHRVDAEGPALIADLTDDLVDRMDAPGLSVDLVRALLLLQLDQPRVSRRVIKYLRCEPLSDHDRRILGDLAPRHPDEAPGRIVDELRTAIGIATGRVLVVCADQLEDMYNRDERAERFARAMDELKTVAELPGTVVVVSCLHVFYAQMRQGLSESVVQRLESDPPPTTLTGGRGPDEVRKLIAKRLAELYRTAGVAFDPAEPLFPLTESHVAAIAGQSTRGVIADLQRLRDEAIRRGQIVDVERIAPDGAGAPARTGPPLREAWNDYKSGLAGVDHQPPDEDSALLELLIAAVRSVAHELPGHLAVEPHPEETAFRVVVQTPDGATQPLFVALCQRPTVGGGLARQLTRIARAAAGLPCVLVRSTPFPRTPSARTQVRRIGRTGGRTLVIEDADWRHMLALQRFAALYGDAAGRFEDFLAQERPLSQLPSIAALLDLGAQRLADPTAGSDRDAPVAMGRSLDTSDPVALDPHQLTRHLAWIGRRGIGKTASALHLIEQLLMRGIPALVVDRRGDLCSYADPAAWGAEPVDPSVAEGRAALQRRVDVALYTPGHPSGRGIAVPLVPPGLAQATAPERQGVLEVASAALADVLGYGRGVTAGRKRAALQIALGLLVARGDPPELPRLIQFLMDRPGELMRSLDELSRYVVDLTMDLQALGTRKGSLLGIGCEPLDAAVLFGHDDRARPDRSRLSIVSTSFLGSQVDIQFWITQLILELDRYARAAPMGGLRGVVLLEEADAYLPARGQPPTRRATLDLLDRASGAGLGVMLVCRSPEDLDPQVHDRIGTWLVGPMGDGGGGDRIEPLLRAAGVDPDRTAALEAGGFHLLTGGSAVALASGRAAVALTDRPSEVAILSLAAALRP